MALAGARTSSITLTTGSNPYSGFGFTPLFVFIFIDKKSSGTDNSGRMMIGMFDGTRKSSRQVLADSGGQNTLRDTTKPIFFQERVAGTLTTRLDGTVSLDADGLTFTMTSADANFQTTYVALG